MPVKYCPHCGQLPALPASYCDLCGTSLPVMREIEDLSSSSSAPQFQPAGSRAKVPTPVKDEDDGSDESGGEKPDEEASQEEKHDEVYYVDSHALTTMLTCAFRNAPLNTEFLFLRDKATGREQIVPLYCISSLKGLEVVTSGRVVFLIGEGGGGETDFFINLQYVLSDEVIEAYLQTLKEPTLRMIIRCSYDPEMWAEPSPTTPGRWEGSGKLILVDSQSLLSSEMMKHNMQRHVIWYSKCCIPKYDASKKEHDEYLAARRESIKKLSDTPKFEANFHCMVFHWADKGAFYKTCLKDDDPQAGWNTAVASAGQIRGMSFRGRGSLLSGRRSPRIAVVRPGRRIPPAGKIRQYGRRV